MAPKKKKAEKAKEKRKGKGKGKKGQRECVHLLNYRNRGIKAKLELNELGRPVGRYKSWFSSWLGRAVMEFIPCYVNAPAEELIYRIWEEINSVFEFEVEKIDITWVNQKLHKMHRDWRYELGTYIDGKNQNKCVYDRFSSLKPVHWEEFKKIHSFPQLKAVSEKAKESANSNDYPHNLSRDGYYCLSQTLHAQYHEKEKIRAEEEGLPVPSIEDIPMPSRSRLGHAARLNLSGEHYNESCKTIGDRIDQYSQQASQGIFKPEGRKDVLPMGIGKEEHDGLVRGAGEGFGMKDFFGRSRKVQAKSSSCKDELDELKQELGTSWVRYKEQQGEGANPMIFLDQILSQWAGPIPESQPCFASSTYLPQSQQHPMPPLGDNTEVNVTDIECEGDSYSPLEVLQEKLSLIWMKGNDFVVEIPDEHAGYAEEAHFGTSDIQDLLLQKRGLNAPWMQIAIVALHEKIKESGRKDIYFITPLVINDYMPKKTIDQYLLERFKICGSKIIMSPINVGNHWVLVMIFIASNEFIICDPMNGEMIEGGITSLLEDCYTKAFFKATRRNANWNMWKAPQQLRDWQCAYYVIRYMFDVVVFSTREDLTDDIKTFLTAVRFYKEVELDEIRVFLAASILKYLP